MVSICSWGGPLCRAGGVQSKGGSHEHTQQLEESHAESATHAIKENTPEYDLEIADSRRGETQDELNDEIKNLEHAQEQVRDLTAKSAADPKSEELAKKLHKAKIHLSDVETGVTRTREQFKRDQAKYEDLVKHVGVSLKKVQNTGSQNSESGGSDSIGSEGKECKVDCR